MITLERTVDGCVTCFPFLRQLDGWMCCAVGGAGCASRSTVVCLRLRKCRYKTPPSTRVVSARRPSVKPTASETVVLVEPIDGAAVDGADIPDPELDIDVSVAVGSNADASSTRRILYNRGAT
jgi:hypothetical protein